MIYVYVYIYIYHDAIYAICYRILPSIAQPKARWCWATPTAWRMLESLHRPGNFTVPWRTYWRHGWWSWESTTGPGKNGGKTGEKTGEKLGKTGNNWGKCEVLNGKTMKNPAKSPRSWWCSHFLMIDVAIALALVSLHPHLQSGTHKKFQEKWSVDISGSRGIIWLLEWCIPDGARSLVNHHFPNQSDQINWESAILRLTHIPTM